MKTKVEIVGVRFKKGAGALLASTPPLTALLIVPEPTNKFDPNAMAVYLGSTQVGYVAKGIAATMERRVHEGTLHKPFEKVFEVEFEAQQALEKGNDDIPAPPKASLTEPSL